MADSECCRCGECCRVIVLSTQHMHPDYLHYLRTKGLKEDQGFILIPHDCQHLKQQLKSNCVVQGSIIHSPDYEPFEWCCDIHESPDRPEICQRYHGQKRGANHTLFYVPPRCTMRKEP